MRTQTLIILLLLMLTTGMALFYLQPEGSEAIFEDDYETHEECHEYDVKWLHSHQIDATRYQDLLDKVCMMELSSNTRREKRFVGALVSMGTSAIGGVFRNGKTEKDLEREDAYNTYVNRIKARNRQEEKLKHDLTMFAENPSYDIMRKIVRFDRSVEQYLPLDYGFPQDSLAELWELLSKKTIYCGKNNQLKLRVCGPANENRRNGELQLVVPIGFFDESGTIYTYKPFPIFAVSFDFVGQTESAKNCSKLGPKLWHCTSLAAFYKRTAPEEIKCLVEKSSDCPESTINVPTQVFRTDYTDEFVLLASKTSKTYKTGCGTAKETTELFPSSNHVLLRLSLNETICCLNEKIQWNPRRYLYNFSPSSFES